MSLAAGSILSQTASARGSQGDEIPGFKRSLFKDETLGGEGGELLFSKLVTFFFALVVLLTSTAIEIYRAK